MRPLYSFSLNILALIGMRYWLSHNPNGEVRIATLYSKRFYHKPIVHHYILYHNYEIPSMDQIPLTKVDPWLYAVDGSWHFA